MNRACLGQETESRPGRTDSRTGLARFAHGFAASRKGGFAQQPLKAHSIPGKIRARRIRAPNSRSQP